MVRVSIECDQDKLLELVPDLIKHKLKFMVKPEIEVIDNKVIITDQRTSSLGKHNKHHVKLKIPDFIIQWFNEHPLAIMSSIDFVDIIENEGWNSGSVSGALYKLFTENKLTRTKEGKSFYYALPK